MAKVEKEEEGSENKNHGSSKEEERWGGRRHLDSPPAFLGRGMGKGRGLEEGEEDRGGEREDVTRKLYVSRGGSEKGEKKSGKDEISSRSLEDNAVSGILFSHCVHGIVSLFSPRMEIATHVRLNCTLVMHDTKSSPTLLSPPSPPI